MSDCLTWVRQGLVVTTAMAALAEMAGSGRRYLYLVTGLTLSIGASLSILFVATTGIRANVFTALTGLVYAAPDLGGLHFMIVPSKDGFGILAATLPLHLLAWRWRRLDWRPSLRRVALAGSICLMTIVVRVAWYDYGGGRLDGAAKLETLGSIVDPGVPISTFVTLGRALPLARGMVLRRGRPAPIVSVPSGRGPLTLIVIVGESTTRNHMSLYGYCRDTTPALSEQAANLFVYHDTISEVPLTVFALSDGLRVSLDQPQGKENQSILDVFNAAAFRTYWLSNQYDAPSDPIGSVTRLAQHHAMLYRSRTDADHPGTFDEALLVPMDAILSSVPDSKIIFLHTIGTHSFYQDRIPAAFLPNGFREPIISRDARRAAVIDAYDTAVRYVDSVIAETITRAGRQGGDVAVIYFSDHGDEVFDRIDFVGHRYPRPTRNMVEIPLLVWLSPRLRADQPALVDALAAARAKSLDMRDIPPLLLDIAGIGVDGLVDRRRPLSREFEPRQRLVGRVDYDVDPTLGIKTQLPPVCP